MNRVNVALAVGVAVLIGLSVSIASRDDRERVEWAVGSPRVAAENRVRVRYGVRVLDTGWRLEETYDANDGLRSYTYVHDGENGRETKVVDRVATSGALIRDVEVFVSGRDYKDPDGAWVPEQVNATFAFRVGEFTDMSYWGADESLERLAHNSFPVHTKNVREVLEAMRKAAISAPGGPRGR